MASLVERLDDLTGRSLFWRCGHERTDENTASGQCRTCRNERQRRYDSDPKRRAAIYARAKARRAANPKGKAALNARITALEAMCETLAGALELVMVGGNHLALLIGVDHPPRTASHEDALAHYGAGDAYEIWCCWRTIMDASQALTQYRAMKEKNDG